MYREIRGLHEAAYILAVFALGSQVLALIRDHLFAHQFGASAPLDVYYAAFRIPDVLFAIFTSILSVYVLIPFVADRMEKSIEKARELLSVVFTWFLIGYGVLAGIIFIWAHPLAQLVFPGFGATAQQDLLVLVLRILLLQPFFLSLQSLFGVVTQMHRKFILYAISPLLYNIGIILGIVLFYPMMGLPGLAVGVVVGALLHMSIQMPFVYQSGLFPRITTCVDSVLLWSILKSSLPRALTLMLQQFVLLALTAVATVMSVGSVTVLQFAYNLQSVPLTIIGVSYAVAAFPTFARAYSSGDRTAFLNHVYSALRHIIFWSIPTIALFVVIRAQIVRVILGSGAFDWNDTRLTAAVLALFVISLVAQSVHNLIIRAFYAGGSSRTPLIVTLTSSIGIVCVSVLFYFLYGHVSLFASTLRDAFRVEDVPGTEVLTIPLAFSLVFIIHSIVLVSLFVREYGTGGVSQLRRVLWQSLGAGVTIAAVSYAALNLLVEGFQTDRFVGIFMQGFVAGILGIVAGVIFLWSANSPELKEVHLSLGHRFWKARPIVMQEKE
jgi:putative peptidoglycan lipid II flippase